MKTGVSPRKFFRHRGLPWWMTPIFFWLCLLALGVTFFTLYERFPFL